VTSSSTAGTATTYTYGDNSSNMGLLVSTTRGSNTISYTYNQYGHVAEETRTVSGLGTRTFQYTYGGNGQLSNVLYPGTVNVGYQYDSYGNRSKVTVGGTTVWQIANITAQNSAVTTTVKLGNILKASTVNDLAGRVTDKWLSYIYGVPIRSMTFSYNPATGNMTGRTGRISGDGSL
jgi:YD repeat-containing protein